MTTLQAVELGVLGPLQVRQQGAPVAIPGAKPRAILTMLGLHNGSVVSADALVELLWGEDPPRTAVKALQTHISSLRRTLGDGFVLTQGAGWTLAESEVDASRYKSAARRGRDAATAGDTSQAVARFEEALALWRGIPELPDSRRGTSEKTRWVEGHAALVEDRADALLATGRAAEIIGELEAAVADAPLRERRWGQLMLALYRAGRQGDALGAYQRARALLADELGIDPGPELRRLETAIVAQDAALEVVAAQSLPSVMRAVTFLLTDIEGSTAAWEAEADAMTVALARHDELVEQVVTSRGGRLIKTRGEGDATFSVFERPSAAAAAAIELQDAIVHEPWTLREPIRIRVALHTGEVELRDGDYFGRAVNRAARLRSLAEGGQILCSGATAELVIDSLSDDVVLNDLGMRQLRNLARPEHVFELRLETADEHRQAVPPDEPVARPSLPAVLAGTGPFVGRERELGQLFSAWQTTLSGGTNAALIAGEPGVGKTRLAGEWSRQAYDQGALVIYGRCDEDLGAAYQPFAEALRSLVPCLGSSSLRGLRGVEALLALVPGLTDVLPDLAAPTRADPDTERYALFDAVVALLGVASASAPVVLILDDLHWAAKPTLLLLRHLLRFGDQARVQIIGTYRSTDLDRSHPLAAMLADLHRDGTANRIQLSGLDEKDVTAYVAEAGYDDEELARALASVTGGNPFFLIEALRHVDESGGHWDPSTLPQGVREAVSRRLSRLPAETNKALAAAAVVGSRFALELVEHVVGDDLVDAFDEASKAGIIIEEHGGHYRFNHALVRQSLLAELASVRRMRLHQRIAATLENAPGADDELLAELAYHYFECAWAGNAAKAVDYCRRAADQAMARLGYEGAADLYDHALHALEEIDDELPDRNDQASELLVARCEALLAAGDVASAAGAVAQLQGATADSARLAAWATCFDGELSILVHPERLDDVEAALGAAAHKLAEIDDAAGEAKAHTVRATCLARLGRVGDCEIALDDALTAARRARDHRRVNAVLAGAPLAALWGPNPVPRAGGRCLDVVRLLRITTDSPAVEATSTRCQAVLEAFRGRGAAARRMIDSARRTVTELGLRHAFLEVEQFAGIVELVLDDPAEAEPHLRQAYNGFRRMGLDADTAETAALLGRACLALNRDAEADELCTESERLAGHALKPSIAWRTLRAQLLSRGNEHDDARRFAEAAVGLAERTDALVDHGDACASLATVLGGAGDAVGARAAAERAVGLYERKGAAALAEKARGILGAEPPPTPSPPEAPVVELDNACVRAIGRLDATAHRGVWAEVEQLITHHISVENRRKIVGFPRVDLPSSEYASQARRYHQVGPVRHRRTIVAIRGELVALTRLELGTADASPGAPRDEAFQLFGLDKDGRIALEVWFDVEDIDAALAELDTTHARLQEEVRPQTRRPQNAASQLYERFKVCFAARDWRAITEMVADNVLSEDRRRVVNSGLRQGRDALIAELSGLAEIGIEKVTSDVIATRGAHLVLSRIRTSHESFHAVALDILELDADERFVARIVFDLDDIDAAFAELDARYLAGEAAAHTHTWSVIAQAYSALNRREMPPTTPDWVNIDHRRGVSFGLGELPALLASWNLAPDVSSSIEVVHRLNNLGAVVTSASHETSQEGVNAEWRVISVLTVEGDLINRLEVYDEADLDDALAKFDQLSRPAPRLENAASQVYEHFWTCFAARDWVAMAEIFADDSSADDRRRVVNAGIRRGRDAFIADMRAVAEVGTADNITSTVLATRGERLTLNRIHSWALQTELLNVVELNADERTIASVVVFDIEDIDAAFEELDARYLTGEASACSRTWSVVAQAYAALNRHEFPATTPDWVNIDHRGETAFGPGDLIAYLRAGLDFEQDFNIYVGAVHRLTDLGAVIIFAAHETSQAGFGAEWRGVAILTVEGEMINRTEVFDEADVDAAIARFEQLSQPARRLENAASRVCERYLAHFAARDWDALAKVLAHDISIDDRRRVVNAGIRHGRDAEIANLRAIADAGFTYMTSVVIAARGERLILARASGRDNGSEEFLSDALGVLEFNSHNQIAAIVVFDLDDFDAAIAELDARYLAGDAAAYSQTWSVIAGGHAAVNRHELPPTTPDCVSIDHRRGTAFAPGELNAYFRAGWDLDQDIRTYVEVVHRLTDLGAVCTHVGHGVSHQGFDAEWRGVDLLTVDGDMVNRCEVFDEAHLDAAIARFDQLNRPTPGLENAASQVDERFAAHFAARDWDAMAELTADGICIDDRRHVVNAGLRRGRDAEIANLRARAETGMESITSAVIAVRGERLALTRTRFWGHDKRPEDFHTEALCIIEIDSDERIVARVGFDLDDFEAAIAELDARYLAGEAAAHAHTWALVARAYAALNRRERPATTLDWVNIDHRRLAPIADGDLDAYLLATWDLSPQSGIYIEAVHRLDKTGAVVTHVVNGTSQQGFDAEWRTVDLTTYEGDKIKRCELFDETDLDAAIARFDELHPQAPHLENAVSRTHDRLLAYFAARNWTAIGEILADDACTDDRRRVVNSGVRHGRRAVLSELSAVADVVGKNLTSEVIATRGGRLVLRRSRYSGSDEREAYHIDGLELIEADADERLVARVAFDLDDIDAAFEELDARYVAGEAADHAHTWSVIARINAAFNRRELPGADWVTIDHRPLLRTEANDLAALIRSVWDDTPDISIHIEAVHRLSDFGAVVTYTAYGTSPEGLAAEWRTFQLLTVEGDRINRCEIFDETDLDAALARFEELQPQAPRLENAASQLIERFQAYFAARDWAAMAELLADDIVVDDRRRVVNAGVRRGRDVYIADNRAAVEVGAETISSSVIATRGKRLALADVRAVNRGLLPGEFGAEWLGVAEIDADERIATIVVFDLDDIDAAYEELDARYLAGEATAHAHAWSVIARTYTALNRRELPPATPDRAEVDRRRITSTAPGDLVASLRASWDLMPDFAIHIETVHRLTDLGAVLTSAAQGTSQDGFAAEWRDIVVLSVEGDLTNRCELFDEADLDAALARFEELHPQTRRLANAASRVTERCRASLAARDWDAMAEILAEDFSSEDRRRIVNSGVRRGRDVGIKDMQAAVDVIGITYLTSVVIATRGERLELISARVGNDEGPEEVEFEILQVTEIDPDERIAAVITFDVDDTDAAFEELDTRYVAGEAVGHARTWPVIARAYAAVNRHEVPATTPDWTMVDHRPIATFEARDLVAFLDATWNVTAQANIHIEAVHRLSDLGAIVTHASHATSQEGLDAEWHDINLVTVDEDLVDSCEIFDEADLDAALARFEELSRPTQRPENAASQVEQRFLTYFAARDWDAYAEILSDDVCMDDRRHVVNAGVRHGRDAEIASQRAIADVGVTDFTSAVIAVRGRRLALGCYSVLDGWGGSKVLSVSEINAENQIVARVAFDSDEIDAAIEELDARYLAGEAAAHAHIWTAMTQVQAAYNRHEFPPTTEDWVNVDHRSGRAFAPGDMIPYMRATYDVAPNVKGHIEAVHRLNNFGVVITDRLTGTSQEGFAFEWREIGLFAFEGDMVCWFELFDEADLDAALARFDELDRPPLLDNAATRIGARQADAFNRRDMDSFFALMTADGRFEDRRKGLRVVTEGPARRQAVQAVFEEAPSSWRMRAEPIAIRGSRLELTRECYFDTDEADRPMTVEFLHVMEVSHSGLAQDIVSFDPNDIDAAFEELDARYLAGEAAAHAHIWSLMAQNYAALNRYELPPTTPDLVNIDHRHGRAFEPGDIIEYVRATWDMVPNVKMYIETVHRLTNIGAVVTQAMKGTSRDGFDAEWREIALFTFEGDLGNRCEIFDEPDLDAALARFDELDRPPSP